MYVSTWDDFAQAALDLYQANPEAERPQVRCVARYKPAEGVVFFKVTDDRVCIQFRTDQVQDLKRFEKLNKSLSRVLANVPLDAPDPDEAAPVPMAVEATSPKAPSGGATAAAASAGGGGGGGGGKKGRKGK